MHEVHLTSYHFYMSLMHNRVALNWRCSARVSDCRLSGVRIDGKYPALQVADVRAESLKKAVGREVGYGHVECVSRL